MGRPIVRITGKSQDAGKGEAFPWSFLPRAGNSPGAFKEDAPCGRGGNGAISGRAGNSYAVPLELPQAGGLGAAAPKGFFTSTDCNTRLPNQLPN